jgi:hypothetical protein
MQSRVELAGPRHVHDKWHQGGFFACEEKVKAKEMGMKGGGGACLPVGIESQEGTSTCKSLWSFFSD